MLLLPQKLIVDSVTSRASAKPNGYGWVTYRVVGAFSAPLGSVFIFLMLDLFGASCQTAISKSFLASENINI